jgi:hypothetical protein
VIKYNTFTAHFVIADDVSDNQFIWNNNEYFLDEFPGCFRSHFEWHLNLRRDHTLNTIKANSDMLPEIRLMWRRLNEVRETLV